jgi:hypothetical protein
VRLGLIFVCLYRLLPRVRDALAIVKPDFRGALGRASNAKLIDAMSHEAAVLMQREIESIAIQSAV